VNIHAHCRQRQYLPAKDHKVPAGRERFDRSSTANTVNIKLEFRIRAHSEIKMIFKHTEERWALLMLVLIVVAFTLDCYRDNPADEVLANICDSRPFPSRPDRSTSPASGK
jgi:hypothetical protein